MAALIPFTNDVEETVTCSICNDIFTDPKTLPCLHTYCTKCILQLYETKSEELEEELLHCPQCHTRIDTSEQRDPDRRRSFYIDALLKLFFALKKTSTQDKAGQQDLQKSEHCTSCDKCAILVAFCPQCEGNICHECFGAHKSMKQLQHMHQSTMLNEFKKENLQDFVEKQRFCMEEFHDEKPCDMQPASQYFYCKEETCKRFICQWCLLMTHRNHDTDVVEKAGEQFKKTIEEDIARLEKVKEGFEKELSLSKQNIARIVSEVEQARLKIEEEKNSVIKKANDHAKAMNEALDKLLLEQKNLYQDEECSINEVTKQVTEYQGRCQNVIERNVPYDMSEKQELIHARTNTLSQPSLKPVKRLRVHYHCTSNFMGFFGSVVESVVDPSLSSIDSLKEVREGFWNEFEIVTRNSDGKMWYAQDEMPFVSITEINDNDEKSVQEFSVETRKEVIDEKNGRYRVKFKAVKATQYEIRASTGSRFGFCSEENQLKNSPQIISTPSIDANFNPLKTIGENGVGDGQLLIPRSIAIGDGKIAIADSAAHRILLFDLDGKNLQEFGNKRLEEGGGELTWPFGVVFVKGRILVSDQPENGRIQEFDSQGAYLRTVYRPEQEVIPRGMCVDDDDDVAVCCHFRHIDVGAVLLLGKERNVIETFTVTGGIPLHITFGDKKYFVSFVSKDYIHALNKDGELVFTFRDLEKIDGLLNTAYGLTFYGKGMILVCDGNNNRVEQHTKEGRFVQAFGTPGSGIGQMMHPLDVAVSADGQVFVLELEGIRVHVWK